jgi:hypothetical protein
VTDSLELLILLALVYLVECGQWVPPATVAFHALIPGRWRTTRVLRGSSRWRRGMVLGCPWPPLGSALVSEPLPLAMSPTGITPEEHGGQIPWERIEEVGTTDWTLEVNGQQIARLASRRLAQTLARTLDELRGLEPSERPAAVERLLDQRFDAETLPARLAAFTRGTRLLRVSASLLWLCIFGGLPAILHSQLIQYWAPILGLLLLTWITTAILFRLALRRPGLLAPPLWPDRLHRFLVAASPLSAIRAADLIAREVAGELDPLVVSAALLDEKRFAEQARVTLVDLTHGRVRHESSPESDRAWLTERLEPRVRRLLEARGVDIQRLLAPPAREDDRVRAYCPRCLSQYTEQRGASCPNEACAGMPLLPFDAPPG